ncbi:MAG: single-stranded-DNA-specific exonuclease RecJ [Eubacteriales bacterium]|nr:single-stranded-DNA-specific exonuclease RecJ [Eubacteriales bacterium]
MYTKRTGLTPDPNEIRRVSRELGLEPIVAEILLSRGMEDEDRIRAFLSPDLTAPLPTLDCPSKERALARIRAAAENGERICVYGDYDADGVCATAIMIRALRQMNADVFYYIPSRTQEGYGMNDAAVAGIAARGARLIVTVDCGVSSRDEIAFCRRLGLDVVVTDHHLPQEGRVPDAVVVDPHLDGETSRNLCGAGVAYMLARELVGENDEACILAGIATLADSMPIDGLNRSLIARAASMIGRRGPAGLRALLEVAGVDPENAAVETLAYTVVPRINAAGRLGDASVAVEMLIGDSGDAAVRLDRLNAERQRLCAEIAEQADTMLKAGPLPGVIVLAGEKWNHAVVGIVASRLVEKYNRPALLLGAENDEGIRTGSGRSVEGFDLFGALNACKDLLTRFGGHVMAAGFSLRSENVPELARRLNEIFDSLPDRENLLCRKEKYDCDLPLSAFNLSLAEQLARFEPCGEGNEPPVLRLNACRIVSWKPVGKGGEHVRVTLSQGGTTATAVAFRAAADFAAAGRPLLLDALVSVSVNTYQGRKSPSMRLISYRLWNAAELLGAYEEATDRRERPDVRLSRDDLAARWRELRAAGTVSFERYCAVHEKNAAAIAVFRELGLLKIDTDGIIILMPKEKGGADLNDSALFRQIKERTEFTDTGKDDE